MHGRGFEALVSKDDLERVTVGGQIGNFFVDRKTVEMLSQESLMTAEAMAYSLVVNNPEYEFQTTDRMNEVIPGFMIAWRRRKKSDDQGEDGAREGGSAAGQSEVETNHARKSSESDGGGRSSILDSLERFDG